MDTVKLDSTTLAKLPNNFNGSPIQIQDSDGVVVGYYVSPEQMEEIRNHRQWLYALAWEKYPPEEIARMEERQRLDPRPDIPNEEVMAWIESL